MHDSSSGAQFDSLRITVDALAGKHALVVIGGGRTQDGADVVARGLAEAFAGAKARVALLSSDAPQRVAGPDVETLPLLPVLLLKGPELKARLFELRAAYDLVLVEIPELFERSGDAEIARHCDGLVLALELNRRIRRQDTEIGATLDRLGVRRFGVVTTPGEKRRLHARTAEAGARSTLMPQSSPQRI